MVYSEIYFFFISLLWYSLELYQISDSGDRMSALSNCVWEVVGLIPSQVIPKILKMVLATFWKWSEGTELVGPVSV